MAGTDRWNWPRGSGSLDVQLRQAVQGSLFPPMEVCELTATTDGTMGRRALEGNGRTNLEGNRIWERGAGKAPGGPSGPLAPASAVKPLTLC